ncbi:MAG: TlpA family protein disulfide reductase [Alistipes sp.]|nr:TlpA family protein disulfide reductase [Alistipes sp.]
MKRLFTLILALVAVVAASAQQLPDVKVENAEGKVISVRELTGKPLIICYWSITCKPCIQELMTILDQIEDWKAEADFEVVAVSVDDARLKATAKAKSKAFGDDFICLFDYNQALKRAMNVSLTPQSFVVDGKGNIVYSHTGYTPGSEQELIEKVIEISKKK